MIDKFRGDSDAEETLALGKKRPDSKGQESALRRSWQRSGRNVGLDGRNLQTLRTGQPAISILF